MSGSHPKVPGKYEILEKIHQGGMGDIYRVRHRLLEIERVIKMIRPQLASEDKFRRRFLEEARGATQLDHPNVAKLHDFSVSEDGTTWMVMEYIPGLSLKEMLLELGPPDLALTLEIGRQCLRALGFLHRKGWVHRDISPDNIMLAEDVDHQPLVKLIDLGIAKKVTGGVDLTSADHFFAKMR
ncbi:MAG: serine/threonine-protein kinase, partial [Acidobacteriota bacterium]